MPARSDIQFDFIAYPQNKSAGIFHPPFLIGDNQLSFKIGGVAADLQRHDERNGMIAAVNSKSSVDCNLRTALRQERTRYLRCCERGIWILFALQDVRVHPPVALAVTALPALDVNYHQARGRPR